MGAGEAFGEAPLPGTLIVLHAKDCEEPWVLPTDTPPEHTEASLYACRHWIEQGFRGPGGAAGSGAARAAPTPCAWPGTGWSWPWPSCCRSPTAPAANRPAPAAGRLRRPPTRGPSKPRGPRRFSLLRQGAACLRRLLYRNRLWARVWLTPTPGPDRTAGLRCLSPPAA